ncbi:hypothetical protein [Embleya sp. MST-111070]|uniref:hypothetical protein n=1 Tax=Embleya sp. MST-111070 TaxID=3398231 RepID=UPI003F7383B8
MSWLSRAVKTSAVMAAAGALTVVGTGAAHAVGVNASSVDARFTGSYFITNSAVKVNGTLKDFGNSSGQSAVYVNIHSTEGNVNYQLEPVNNGKSKTYPTLYNNYGGTFLSGTITVCSWAGSWKCGTAVGIYK